MFDFFDWIIEAFTTIFSVVSNIFSSLISAFRTLLLALPLPSYLLGFLPSVVGGSMVIVIGIAVAKFIIGRDNA